MSPKFRGDSDDWLDDDEGRLPAKHPPRSKSKARDEKKFIDASTCNATVSEIYPDLCQVLLDAGQGRRLCTYRRGQFASHHDERSPVSVGDRVKVTVLNDRDATIEGMSERQSSFIRKAPGENEDKPIHVIAANVDQVAIVSSVMNPDFNCGVVDRLCIAALSRGIQPLIIVSKTDLCATRQDAAWSIYRDAGFRVLEVCAKTGTGVAELKAELAEKQTAFCGHSGVGKTTLLRRVLDREIGKVGEVNERTGKGRHTTTGAALYELPDCDAILIDTPGIREFDLAPIDSLVLRESVSRLFPELKPFLTEDRPLVEAIETLPVEIAGLPRIVALKKVVEECSGAS